MVSLTGDFPYVTVELSSIQHDSDKLYETASTLSKRGIDGISVDLYRTDYLISLIHRPDKGNELRERQLNKETFLELYEKFNTENFDVHATIYDPKLLQWYADSTDANHAFLHSGDITYKRLIEAFNTVELSPFLNIKASLRDTITSALDWLSNTEETILLHEEYPENEKLARNAVEVLGKIAPGPLGLTDPTGNNNISSPEWRTTFDVWRPTLQSDEAQPGYTIEEIVEICEHLKNYTDNNDNGGDLPNSETEAELTLSERDRKFQKEYRRSLMADRALSAGQSLDNDMVRELRPGGGLPANEINTCSGMLIQRPTDPQEMITY